MAVVAARVTVDDTAGGTLIAANTSINPSFNMNVKYKNLDAADSIYVGGSGVTVAAGWELAAGASDEISLDAGESLYALTAPAGSISVQKLTNSDKKV